jgi:hypothetical protein
LRLYELPLTAKLLHKCHHNVCQLLLTHPVDNIRKNEADTDGFFVESIYSFISYALLSENNLDNQLLHTGSMKAIYSLIKLKDIRF